MSTPSAGPRTPEPARGQDLAFAGAARQAELLRARELSSRELVQLYLERIERLDPQLNSFRVVLGEQALAEAEQAQARLDAGETTPLLGVPVAIKDEFDVAGQLNTLGCGTIDEPAREDSEVVRRLRAAGAIPIGITKVPELTIWPFTETETWGKTRNPWNPDRVPGGSSGGSGAAVAAGLAPVALGSDGAGSIRIPAAWCGLFGLKVQRGRISYMPLPEHWHGMSVPGPLARRVLDAALFLDAVAGPAPGDATAAPPPPEPFAHAARQSPRPLRIAVSTKVPPLATARVSAESRDRGRGDSRPAALPRPSRSRSATLPTASRSTTRCGGICAGSTTTRTRCPIRSVWSGARAPWRASAGWCPPAASPVAGRRSRRWRPASIRCSGNSTC